MSNVSSRTAVALAILTPLVALPLRDGSTVVFYGFVLAALAALMRQRLQHVPAQPCPDLPMLGIALAAPLFSLLAASLKAGYLYSSEFEKALRFALAVPILWLLCQVPVQRLRHVQWGVMGTAAIGSIMLLGILLWQGLDRNAVTAYGARYNAVTFANLTLLFGLSCVLMLPWRLTRWPRLEAAAKIALACLSCYAVLLSGTRSSWMLLPIFLVVAALGGPADRRNRRRIAGLAAGGAVVLVLAGILVYTVNPRMSAVALEIHQFFDGQVRDTSIGMRLQLWHASLLIYGENPWLGVGPGKFREALQALVPRGVVTPLVAAGFGEPHNDLLAAMANYGTIGLLAICALYVIPAALFYRRLRSPWVETRVAARVGLLICAGYAAFSLTETMFRNMRGVPIYSCMVVIMASLARAPHTHARQPAPAPRPPATDPRPHR